MEDVNIEKKPESEVIDVQELANKWMESQARMCDVILALVRKSQ